MTKEQVDGLNSILYSDNNKSVDVVFKDETIWLTQKGIAELFDTDQSGIARHLKSIFDTGELKEKLLCKKCITTLLTNQYSTTT